MGSILQPTEWTLNLLKAIRKEEIFLRVIPRKRPVPKVFPVRRRIAYCPLEFGNTNRTETTAEALQQLQAEIPIRGMHEAIDQLPQSTRQLFEEQRFVSVKENGSSILFIKQDDFNQISGGADLDAEQQMGISTPATRYFAGEDLPSDLPWPKLRKLQRQVEDLQQSTPFFSAPALAKYLADVCPDHPMDNVQPVLLEQGVLPKTEISILEGESKAVILLLGTAKAEVDDKVILLEDEENHEVFEIDGPANLLLTTHSQEALLAVGSPEVEEGRLQTYMDCLSRALNSLGSVNMSSAGDSGSEEFDFEEDSEESEEDSSVIGLSFFTQSTKYILPSLSELNRDLPSTSEDQKILWHKETAGKINFNEWYIRRKLRTLDEILTLDIDSPYHGQGYIPPSPRWSRIVEEPVHSAIKAAEEREERFKVFHAVAKRVDSLSMAKTFRQRIRPINQADKQRAIDWSVPSKGQKGLSAFETHRQRFKRLLKDLSVFLIKCPLCGIQFVSGPSYKDYRQAYLVAVGREDPSTLDIKETNYHCPRHHPPSYWDAVGNEQYQVLERHPITKVPVAYAPPKARANGNFVNLLENRCWLAFDRQRTVIPPEFSFSLVCKTCGTEFSTICSRKDLDSVPCPRCKVAPKDKTKWHHLFIHKSSEQVTGTTYYEDSWWYKDRAKAFEDMFLKKSQWHTIYDQLRIQQERIRQHYLSTVSKDSAPVRKRLWRENCDKAMTILRSLFQGCDGKADYKELLRLAEEQKRHPVTGAIITRSLFDQITLGDEQRVRIATDKA